MASTTIKVLNKINDRLNKLQNDYITITTGIVFTSDTEFYYIFKIYYLDKLKETIKADTDKDYERIYSKLADKYNALIQVDYSDLTDKQLMYLTGENRTEPVAVEMGNIFMEVYNRNGKDK